MVLNPLSQPMTFRNFKGRLRFWLEACPDSPYIYVAIQGRNEGRVPLLLVTREQALRLTDQLN